MHSGSVFMNNLNDQSISSLFQQQQIIANGSKTLAVRTQEKQRGLSGGSIRIEGSTLGRNPHKNCKMTLTIKLNGNWNSFQLAKQRTSAKRHGQRSCPFRKDANKDEDKHLFLFCLFSCLFCSLLRLRKDHHTDCEIHCYPEGCAAPGCAPCQCNCYSKLGLPTQGDIGGFTNPMSQFLP